MASLAGSSAPGGCACGDVRRPLGRTSKQVQSRHAEDCGAVKVEVVVIRSNKAMK